MVLATPEEIQLLGHKQHEPGIVFQYFDPFTGQFIDLEEFHRVRYLAQPTGFAAMTKGQRYSQPSGTLNSVYVPRMVEGKNYNWSKHLKDPTLPLYITEGEKKAAAACKKGIHCVGLGGVSMYQSTKRGADSLPILDKIVFKGRRVGIVFDTDTPDGLKSQVLSAANSLMNWLLLKGATPFLVILPSAAGKVGFDDWLLKHDALDFEALIETNTVRCTDANTLTEVSKQYKYVIEIDRFVDVDTHLFLNAKHLDAVVGNVQVTLPRLKALKKKDEPTVTRMVPTVIDMSEAMTMWPGAEKYEGLVYEPGSGPVVLRNERQYMNLWQGWKCEYAGKGTLVSPARRNIIMKEWHWAMDNIFADDSTAREFAEHWLMYPLQNPGAKMNTFALICSPEEGIGKSFIGHMLAKHVYGLTKPGARHAWQLTEGDLASQFNPYMFATSFVEGDDIAAHDKKSVYERVKSFTTSDTVQINIKNQPQFMMESHCNFWLTSNDPAPFYLNENSRRAFIHIPKRAKKDRERYHALQLMFDSGEAGPTLLHYAREHYQVGSFTPVVDAPMTMGKQELSHNSASFEKAWLRDLTHAPELLTRSVATAREIKALMEQEGIEPKSLDSIGRHLSEVGAVRWGGGIQANVQNLDGSNRRERVWCFGIPAPMRNASKGDVEDMLKVPFGFSKGGKVVDIKVAKKF